MSIKSPKYFTRRDFLKFSVAGMLGMLFAETGLKRALALDTPPASHGRVLLSGLNLYELPNFGSEKYKAFGKDQVIELTAAEEGEAGNPYNNIWYKVGDEGYTYSGWVQPVETRYNKPVFEIRQPGQVGEITVPFSIPRRSPSMYAKNAYRLYYQTTHWIKGTIVNREEKGIWYEVYDFLKHESIYVPAHDMRIIPDEELSPLSPEVPEALKSIHVDLGTQTVTAFEDDKPVLVARCASGAGGTKTPTGDFRTYHKGPSVRMTNEGDEEIGVYDLPGVPWVSFFTGTGIAFHGTYWHNDYGRPRSHGCINLTSDDSKFIYRWTSPVVPPDVNYLHLPGQGTAVHVTKSQ